MVISVVRSLMSLLFGRAEILTVHDTSVLWSLTYIERCAMVGSSDTLPANKLRMERSVTRWYTRVHDWTFRVVSWHIP